MNDDRRTPRALFDKLNEVFRFELDLAASAENTLCKQFYCLADDAFVHEWGNVPSFCNPPYSRGQLFKWVEKASREHDPQPVVMLIPGDTSTQATQLALKTANTILFLNRRLKFDNESQGAKFASWVVVWGGTKAQVSVLDALDLGVVLNLEHRE